MVIEINTNDVFPVSSAQPTGVKKVGQVQEAHLLPDDGKELPAVLNKSQPDDSEIENAVREINEHVQIVKRELQFTVDKESATTVIKVVDASTQEVIRQIPGDEALRVARRLNEGENLEIFNSYS